MSIKAYKAQKTNAKQRGIFFDLTYGQWLDFWGDDINKRGTGENQLGMLRFRDEGGYVLENIRKGTPKENHQEAATARKVQRAQKPIDTGEFRLKPPVSTSWVSKRHKVFEEYIEEDE